MTNPETISDFSGSDKVRDLALAEEGIETEEPLKYAIRAAIISVLETQLMGLHIEAEKLQIQKIKLESVFREETEFDTTFKNADQRKTAFDKKCLNCDPLQKTNFDINENKWSPKKITIELGNQQRAFTLKVNGAGQ